MQSPDGSHLAFDVSDSGSLYLVDVASGRCVLLSMSTPSWGQYFRPGPLAFSPDSKLLAYVDERLLHTFDLNTGRRVDVPLIASGTAAIPVGPPIWNSAGNRIYVAAASAVADARSPSSSRLLRVSGILNGTTSTEEVAVLPDFVGSCVHPAQADLKACELQDAPNVYAISPDESRAAVVRNGNLVLLDFRDGTSSIVWRRPLAGTTPGRDVRPPVAVFWASTDWLLWETRVVCCGSTDAAPIWRSRGGLDPQPMNGYEVALSPDGRRFAYNFEFFGDYYVGPGHATPPGFDPAGHKYDGLGIFDLVTGVDTRFEGPTAPRGLAESWSN